jgi:hypothetical protein
MTKRPLYFDMYPGEIFQEQADRFGLALQELKIACLRDIRDGLAWLRREAQSRHG